MSLAARNFGNLRAPAAVVVDFVFVVFGVLFEERFFKVTWCHRSTHYAMKKV